MEHTFCLIIFFELDIQVYGGHALRLHGWPRGSKDDSFHQTGLTRATNIQYLLFCLYFLLNLFGNYNTLRKKVWAALKDLHSDHDIVQLEEKGVSKI